MATRDLDEALRLTNVDYGVRSGQLILKDVSVSVPKGGIYAILGPSGCGKTTLLKILSGLVAPAKGTVEYSYKDFETRRIPGNGIGYMPQDTGLAEELSVEENLRLFSSLNDVGNDFQERKQTLMAMLDLRDIGGKLVGNMSGGEKRRLSLVVALLHHPPIVVLDEPTVGVDPLLRKTIWKHLARLTTDGTTVIITTHYVDEAKDADWISFMRTGRVIAETTPTAFQEHYEETHIETCYTKLFQDDETGNTSSFKVFKGSLKNTINERELCEKTYLGEKSPISLRADMRKLRALTIRNLHFLRRNLAAVGFLLIISIIQPILFSTIVGSPLTALPIAVANEESPKILSSQFLKELDKDTLWIENYLHRNEAIESVKDGTNCGAIHIGANFTRCLFRRFRDGLQVANSTIDCSSVKVYMDNTNSQIFDAVTTKLYSALSSFSKKMLVAAGGNPVLSGSPMEFQNPPIYGDFDVTMTEYVLPNLLICLVFMTGTMGTALCLVAEKQSGALHRILVTGATRTQLLLSQFFCQMVITLVQTIIMLFVPYVVFAIPIQGSIVLSISNLILMNVCANAFGLFVSSLTDTFYAVINVLNGFLYPATFISGFFWPLEGMPTFLRYIAYFIPMTMQMHSLRCTISRGWGLESVQVFLGFVSSVVWTTIFMTASILVFKHRK